MQQTQKRVDHSTWRWLIATAALVLVIGAGIVIFAFPRLPEAGGEAGDDAGAAAVVVEVASAARRDIERTARMSGRITARASVDLTPKISGQVREVYVEMGQEVEEGDALVRLDDVDVQPQVLQAEAVLEAARAQLSQVKRGAREEEIDQLRSARDGAQAAVESAQWLYERVERLYQRDVASGAELQEARSAYESARAQLEGAEANLQLALDGPDEETVQVARAQVREAEAAVQGVRQAVEDTVIRAPMSGTVSYVTVDPGDMLGVEMAAVGIVDMDPVRVDALVTDRVVGALTVGDEVAVEVEAIDGEFTGVISEVAPAPEPESGQYPVRVLVENPGEQLKPGMMAEVQFVRERVRDVLAVPRGAVSARADEHYVFVVEDDVARRRPVRVGLQDEEYTEITSGLQGGDAVVHYGLEYLEDGSPVEVIEERE